MPWPPLTGSTTACRILLLLALAITTYATTAELTHPAATGIPDKLAHFATFFLLSLLADHSFRKRGFDRRIWGALTLYGLLIELVQHPIPYRSFSLLDWMADVGGILAYGLLVQLARARAQRSLHQQRG